MLRSSEEPAITSAYAFLLVFFISDRSEIHGFSEWNVNGGHDEAHIDGYRMAFLACTATVLLICV